MVVCVENGSRTTAQVIPIFQAGKFNDFILFSINIFENECNEIGWETMVTEMEHLL